MQAITDRTMIVGEVGASGLDAPPLHDADTAHRPRERSAEELRDGAQAVLPQNLYKARTADAPPLLPTASDDASHLPESTAEAMSMPITPRTRKASLLLANESTGQGAPQPTRTLHTSRSMSSLLTPPQARRATPVKRRPRMSYITSPGNDEVRPSLNDTGPRSRSPVAPVGVLGTAKVDALLAACASHDRTQVTEWHKSTLHEDMLHAIAAKERRCMELREQLSTEEGQLTALRNAWHRLAIKAGPNMVPTPSTPSRRADPPPPVPRPNVLSPSSIQASRESAQALPTPAAEAPPPGPPPPRQERTPLGASKSWRGFKRLPHQLSTFMDQITPPQPGDAVQNPAHNNAQWLSTRGSDGGETGGSEQLKYVPRAAPVPHDTRRTPTSRSRDTDSNLGEKLVSGWNVLSKRLIEKTSSLKDPATWNTADPHSTPPSSRGSYIHEYMGEAPQSRSSHESEGASSGSRNSVLGLRSMAWHARQDQETQAGQPLKAPPVPPKLYDTASPNLPSGTFRPADGVDTPTAEQARPSSRGATYRDLPTKDGHIGEEFTSEDIADYTNAADTNGEYDAFVVGDFADEAYGQLPAERSEDAAAASGSASV